MNAEEVAALVKAEIGDQWEQSNAHGVDLRTCIVTPEKKSYTDGVGEKAYELWLVLEEDPKERKGYKIVFDHEQRLFGLATTQRNGPDVFLGFYGTFLETLESM
jgi:hypothetical protein